MKYISLCLSFTVIFLSACSASSEVPPTPTLNAIQQQGQAVFNLRCAQCHALTANTIVIGPSLAGIASRAAGRIEGYSAEEYIEDSILFPKDYLVEGFTDTMPTNFGKDLTSEELNAVVAYLMTLK
jgi:nitric oxide reductase subunit C